MRQSQSKTCSVEGCEKLSCSRGWCRMHYLRWLRHGDFAKLSSHWRDAPTEDRFWNKVRAMPSGCWKWTAATNGWGYGRFRWRGSMTTTHRIAYELLIGPVPPGLDLDHLCRNRICVNPNHMEAVTHRENCLRGEGVCARNSRVTHCPKGHEYTSENTTVRRGHRLCKACKAAWDKDYRARAARLRALAVPAPLSAERGIL